MTHVPGYTLESELYRGRTCVVLRARRDTDGARVIVKSLTADYPEPVEIARLRREYEILQGLTMPGVARAIALETVRDRPVLVLEDHAGATLRTLVARGPLPLDRFFDIALPLAQTLAALHRHGIIHKDVNPNNVLVDTQTGEVTLLDFGISSRGTIEQPSLQQPHVLEGTIAYMSPEQTGRMNLDVDRRSDLYSMGVTLYEMLTGRVPFDSVDPLELIHSHIAHAPAIPTDSMPGLPGTVADVVLRLLAKSPDDRYQTAEGLADDLARCADAWRRTGTVPAFAPGGTDVSDRFAIPRRLYGRDDEVAVLTQAFERVSAGATELVLVSGYSGIGKTSLIRELYKSLPRRRGHVIAGKFDQLARDVPFGAVLPALRLLVRQVLSESESRVRGWASALHGALDPNARVIVDVIPELERIIGSQPVVPPRDPIETQNRFNRTLQKFIGVFARPEHPLVLFLDDLQWADAATLSMLPLLHGSGEMGGLLLIGAYRDNEVSASHPLLLALSDLRAGGARIEEIVLPPLAPAQLERLIADAMRIAPGDAVPVRDLVLAKTGGNPLFVTQFLRVLEQDGLLAFDRETRSWQADLEGIRRANITDNVVDLLTAKIQRLAPATQEVLRLAACVGTRFDLRTLATISERDPARATADLWEAVEQGLVQPVDHSYGFAPDLGAGLEPARVFFRFLHDRVQQAAYALIPEHDRPAVHVGVGRLLLLDGADEGSERVFEVVHHLNYGRALLVDPTERARLAALNLAAGRRAKSSGAYPNAQTYFATGVELLDDAAWDEAHERAFALHIERAEAEYLCGRFTEAEAHFHDLLGRCRSPIERAEVTVRSIVQFETMSRYADAVAAGAVALRPLGVELPDDPDVIRMALEEVLARIEQRLAGRAVASLIDAPRLEDPAIRQAMRLLMSTWAPAYISGRGTLASLVVATMVQLSLEHGNCEESAFGYLHHAITLGYGLDRYEHAFEFGQLALALNDRLQDLRLKAAIHHRFAALVNPWSRPFETSLVHAREAVRVGLESGHLQVAAYAQFQQSWYGTQLERNLVEYETKYAPIIDVLARIKNPAFLEAQKLIFHWSYALRGRTRGPTSLSSADFSENVFACTYGKGGIFEGLLASLRLELLDTFEQVEEARRVARDTEASAELFASSIWPALFAFRHALALCAWLPGAPEMERAPAQVKLDALEARLRRWAGSAPENFAHMHALVVAEIARVGDRAGEAVELYEKAIGLAEKQPSPRHRALANELFGRFWLGRGHPRIAALFLAEARFGFVQWGATAKVSDLDRRYAELLGSAARTDIVGTGAAGTGARGSVPGVLLTTQTSNVALDAIAVARAAQAISREIEIGALLERLMRVTLESAGAERGSILLEREGGPEVFVEGTPEAMQVHTEHGTPLEEASLPVRVIQFVRRTGEVAVLDDATHDERFRDDPYFVREKVRSVLSTPVINQGKVLGVLYVENRLAADAFTPDRVQLLQILSSHAAIAIQNAQLFAEVVRLRERLRAEIVYLQTEIGAHHGFSEIIGETKELSEVLRQIEQVAPMQTTVLITGETGTGKELVARAIHRLSTRADQPLIAVNCGAISPGLVESELFGHEKGAFTGAIARKLGRFELADGGTIFLDEIGDLPLDMQIKLLRVLQGGEIERVGGTRPIKVDVRVVAATHRDLGRAVELDGFRQDLFDRLNVFPIRLPALRQRPGDIPLLVRHFVLSYGSKFGKRIERIPRETMTALCEYSWPGNIRELANVIERSVILSNGNALELGDWIAAVPATRSARGRRARGDVGDGGAGDGRGDDRGDDRGARAGHEAGLELEEMERRHIIKVLEQMRWRVSGPQGAARVLGLRPTTLEARMKKLGIVRPR